MVPISWPQSEQLTTASSSIPPNDGEAILAAHGTFQLNMHGPPPATLMLLGLRIMRVFSIG